MSRSIDQAMMSMTLEEDDEPFDLPNRPEFFSTERNKWSIVGRTLNPDCQKMADLILDMPRKWQLYERVRGVALTKDKFQFIFELEQDLEMVLKKGIHTYNLWPLVIKRWTEDPPADFLDYTDVWVQIRNLPVNHYTPATISTLAEFVGTVREVAFDPMKVQRNDYVRVRVTIDVEKPLRSSKKINFPNIGAVNILYDYERIQKRCFTCQRLTHDHTKCPFIKQNSSKSEAQKHQEEKKKKQAEEPIIKESYLLFGVVSEAQVGLHPASGRPRIAPDVLEGMRQYLMVVNGPERLIREERIKSSLQSLANDPMAEKSMLRLEPPPIITNEVDKGKGVVYDFSNQKSQNKISRPEITESKLMASALKAGYKTDSMAYAVNTYTEEVTAICRKSFESSFNCSMAYRVGSSGPSFSGTMTKKKTQRKRPYVSKRKPKKIDQGGIKDITELKKGLDHGTQDKRKLVELEDESKMSVKRRQPKAIPNEGLPQSQ